MADHQSFYGEKSCQQRAVEAWGKQPNKSGCFGGAARSGQLTCSKPCHLVRDRFRAICAGRRVADKTTGSRWLGLSLLLSALITTLACRMVGIVTGPTAIG
jgi:hypothetical protein